MICLRNAFHSILFNIDLKAIINTFCCECLLAGYSLANSGMQSAMAVCCSRGDLYALSLATKLLLGSGQTTRQADILVCKTSAKHKVTLKYYSDKLNYTVN